MNYNFLTKTRLFQGMSEEDVESVLECLRAKVQSYSKREVIYRAGEDVLSVGLVLRGSVNIEHDDVWGNKNILDNIGEGQVFGETYACIPGEPLMVSVIAAEETEVLFLNTDKLFAACTEVCGYHNKLIQNLLLITAQKNQNLTRKIFHTTPKSIRDKLLSYLSFQAVREGSYRFEIPFNRQQLADYLGVDRSAMSKELGKMQREGLLTFEKNLFCLKEREHGFDK